MGTFDRQGFDEPFQMYSQIEIKFGHITQKGRSERLVLPVKTETRTSFDRSPGTSTLNLRLLTVINEDMIEVGFKSDMPPVCKSI